MVWVVVVLVGARVAKSMVSPFVTALLIDRLLNEVEVIAWMLVLNVLLY